MHKLNTYLILCLILVSCNKEPIKTVDCTTSDCDTEIIKVETLILGGEPIVIVGSKSLSFLHAFETRNPDGEELSFEALQTEFPFVMQDKSGIKYDIFGQAENDASSPLKAVLSTVGYWFAWSSIYPEVILDEMEGIGEVPPSNSEDWLISQDHVSQGAAVDGIPSLNFPSFELFTNKEIFTSGFLFDDDEIIVVQIDGIRKIYPIKILNYHEIVNDTISGEQITICYAPFTSTSSVWSSNINGQVLEFGVSGKVYNNNILLFDRSTNSLWNQLLERSVNGHFINSVPKRIAFLRTTWGTWREVENSHLMLIGKPGTEFNYSEDPLGDYSTNHDYLPFSITYEDNRRRAKDRVYGVVSQGKAYAVDLDKF